MKQQDKPDFEPDFKSVERRQNDEWYYNLEYGYKTADQTGLFWPCLIALIIFGLLSYIFIY